MNFPNVLFGFQAPKIVFKILLGETRSNINEKRHRKSWGMKIYKMTQPSLS